MTEPMPIAVLIDGLDALRDLHRAHELICGCPHAQRCEEAVALDTSIAYVEALIVDDATGGKHIRVGCQGGAPYMTHYGRIGCARCEWAPVTSPDESVSNADAVRILTQPHASDPRNAACGCEPCASNRNEAIEKSTPDGPA